MANNRIDWTLNFGGGTGFSGTYLATPWSFAETVARLSGQDPTAFTDGYKVSVEFSGRFDGQVFTLYDYKGDAEIHIGAAVNGRLDAPGLAAYLARALAAVEPKPFTATVNYDDDVRQYGWPS